MQRATYCMTLLAMLMAACAPLPGASTPTQQALTPVNVCYTSTGAPQAVPWYALANGLFAKYGLDVKLIRVDGSTPAVAALLSGQADICQTVANAVVYGVAAGQDLVMVAGIYNTFPAVLVAKPEIKSADDLRGKEVATGPIGNALEAATRIALAEMGLDPDRDVKLVQVGPEPQPFAAFRAGRVDALLVLPPYLHIAREAGASELFDFGRANVAYAHTSILTRRRYLASDRPIVLNFLKAIVESIPRMKQDPQGTLRVLAQYNGLDLQANAADLDDAYYNTILPYMADIPYPGLDGLQTLITIAGQTNPKAAALKPDQLVDMSLMQELEADGFVRQVQPAP